MYNNKKISAVIVAAGSSRRMKSDVPKILMELLGEKVIHRTARAFENSDYIDEIIVVTREQDIEEIKLILADITKLKTVVPGGSERQESVLNGVHATSGDIIAIHDGARPLVSDEEIRRVIEDAEKYGAATLSAVPKDTVKVADKDGFVSETPDRSTLRNIYTPQVFGREEYLSAAESEEAKRAMYTDDCQLFEKLNKRVFLSEGKYTNIKITTPEDLAIATAIAQGID